METPEFFWNQENNSVCMKKAYIYPISARMNTGVFNPYLDNFIHHNKEIQFLNAEKPSPVGIFDLVKYIPQSDLVFLNWFENVPEKKFGIAQAIFFFFLLPYFKLTGKKIIWTLHNKLSHSKEHFFLKKIIFNGLARYSDMIITHCSEGEKIIKSLQPFSEKEILIFPHPVVPGNFERNKHEKRKCDILIWGTLAPYKGVDKFLRFLKNAGVAGKFRIVIAGKIVDENYRGILTREFTRNVIHHDRFLDNEELLELIRSSKIVLFPYANESVLSSGALMDTLAWGGNVIGPDKGAFKDLGKEGLINTFRDYDDLLNLLLELPEKPDEEGIFNYLRKITWEEFAGELNNRIKKISNGK